MIDVSMLNELLESKTIQDFSGICLSNYLTVIGNNKKANQNYKPEYFREISSGGDNSRFIKMLCNAKKWGECPQDFDTFIDLLNDTAITSPDGKIIGVYPHKESSETSENYYFIAIVVQKNSAETAKYGICIHSGSDPDCVGLTVLNNFTMFSQETITKWEYRIANRKSSFNIYPIGFEETTKNSTISHKTTINYSPVKAFLKYWYSDSSEEIDEKDSQKEIEFNLSFPQLITSKEARYEFERTFANPIDSFAFSLYNSFLKIINQMGLSDNPYDLDIKTLAYNDCSESKAVSSLICCRSGDLISVEFNGDDGHWGIDADGSWEYEGNNNGLTIVGNGLFVNVEQLVSINKDLTKNMNKNGSFVRKLIKKFPKYYYSFFKKMF